MYTYRIDNDNQTGELQTVRTQKEVYQAYAGWKYWTQDSKGQFFCASFFSAWDRKGECIIADFALPAIPF